MDAVIKDIEDQSKENSNFRKVIKTGKHCQLVLMSLQPGQDIGEEVHHDVDQILFIVEGQGEAIVNGNTQEIGVDDIVFVDAESSHNIKNTGEGELKLYTIYAPPQHKDATIHPTKEDALHDTEDHY